MLYADFEKKLDLFTLRVHIDIEGGVFSLFGASGAGKSMTLKCIAGIEKPDRGIIRLGDTVLFDSESHINLTPQKRQVGYLFQEYALFPNMTVKGNILSGLHKLPRKKRDSKVVELMERFRILPLADKKPQYLSGGERQRVALARIFASEPKALLLDEPFSSLDTFLKWELVPYFKETLQSFSGCSIMVSHNLDEVISLCDTVSVIQNGVTEPALDIKSFQTMIRERYPVVNLSTGTIKHD